jgi:hypothetical protein
MISVRFIPELRSPVQGLGVGSGARKLRGDLPAERSAIAFVLLASGVGNNPDAISSVRGTNGWRRNAMPFRINPDLGHVSENRVQPSTKQRCHVLQHREPWSYQANGSNHFPVESRTLAGKSGTFPSKWDVLAGEAGGDDVGLALSELSLGDVGMDRDARPLFAEDGLAELVLFTERDGSHPGSFESEGEAADAAE